MRELLFWTLLAATLLLVTGSDTLGVTDHRPASQLFVCDGATSCIRLEGYESVTASLVASVIQHFGVNAVICRAVDCPRPPNPMAPLIEFLVSTYQAGGSPP